MQLYLLDLFRVFLRVHARVGGLAGLHIAVVFKPQSIGQKRHVLQFGDLPLGAGNAGEVHSSGRICIGRHQDDCWSQ